MFIESIAELKNVNGLSPQKHQVSDHNWRLVYSRSSDSLFSNIALTTDDDLSNGLTVKFTVNAVIGMAADFIGQVNEQIHTLSHEKRTTEIVCNWQQAGKPIQRLKNGGPVVFVVRIEALHQEPPPDIVNSLAHDLTIFHSKHSPATAEGCVHLLCRDETRITVSKLLLVSRSPVFAMMLAAQTIDSISQDLPIIDFSNSTVESYAKYLFSDTLFVPSDSNETQSTLSRKGLADLLRMAHKYETQGLVTLCETALAKTVTLDNVVETAHLADTYHTMYLRNHCVSFIDMYIQVILVQYPNMLHELRGSVASDVALKLARRANL